MRLMFVDCETTGLSPRSDQIIELSLLKESSLGELLTWRFLPTTPISREAFRVHGIGLPHLQGLPAFRAYSNEVLEHLRDCDTLVGFNIEFDWAMLNSEFTRADVRPEDVPKPGLVDVRKLLPPTIPKNLRSAYQAVLGKGFRNAHSAPGDVVATAQLYEQITIGRKDQRIK